MRPSSISIRAPGFNFLNLTPLETGIDLMPGFSFVISTLSPLFTLKGTFNCSILIFGPAKSAKIVGRSPLSKVKDLIKSKYFFLLSFEP